MNFQIRDSLFDVRSWVGAVLALGLLFRTGIHIFTAAALDRNPRLETDLDPRPEGATDVRFVSPVPSLRDDGADMVARLACAAFALFLAWMSPGLAGDSIASHWFMLNWLVLIADPVVGVGLLAWHAIVTSDRAVSESQSTMLPRRD
jgi:hypothetical protein